MTFKSFLGFFGDKDDSPKEPVQWKEKRRDNRIDLSPGKELTVHLLNPEGGETASTLIASVRNVSMRGCGLVFKTKEDREKAEVNKVFVASLAVDDFPIPLNVKILRVIGEREVATQFKPPFPRELEKLERFLEPHCLGRSLREIDPKALQKSMKKGLRWFQGVNETSLFSWDDPVSGMILQQQLVFLDAVVEWKEKQPVRTGRVKQDGRGTEDEVAWIQSELLEFDAKADHALLSQAQTILESSNINDVVKKIFLEKLKEK